MRRILSFLIVFAAVLFLCVLMCGCPQKESGDADTDLVIASWNVQNIFDAVENGTEYSEFLPSSGWNEKMYAARVSNAVTVLGYDRLADADIIVLNEVENDKVVEDILNSPVMKKRNLSWYVTAGEPGAAIKTAVISRMPIKSVRIHSVDGARPVLQAEFETAGERLFVLAVHAKSRLEGIEQTAPVRLETGKVLKTVAASLERDFSGCLVVIAGDFNEDYRDTNMMCDTRTSAGKSTNVPLLLTDRPAYGFWYCMWVDGKKSLWPEGSYNYGGQWFCFDNILISGAGGNKSGWELEDAGVVTTGIIRSSDNKPEAYNRQKLSGVSDHLPVWVSFSLNPGVV
ncbi:MAG: endonuclease/exonuclease/phosphatase family protein [Sphaerochaetaceae bacterium]|nr:endonuclease/exonuclease/phosphatase family protein [Sphaerochaetaceae bacterium]